MRLTKPKHVHSCAHLRKEKRGGTAECLDGEDSPLCVRVAVQDQAIMLFHYPGVPDIQTLSSASTMPVR